MTDPDYLLDLGAGARCGLWWRQSPRLAALPTSESAAPTPSYPIPPAGPSSSIVRISRIGRIGRLEAADAPAACRLLEQACWELRRRGCQAALAPMEATTWEPYRVLEPGQSAAPAFAGESVHSPTWFTRLESAGFHPWIRYGSSLATNLLRRRSARSFPGLRLQPLDAEAALARLDALHPLVMEGFRLQPLFHALDAPTFARMARPWLERMDPRFSLVAYDGENPVGLLLAHGDGGGADGLPRVVVRTLVVRPGRPWSGLGRLLLETCHGRAAGVGMTAAVHALMVDPGPSCALSRPYAAPFRRYALMGRSLQDEPGRAGCWSA